MLNPSRRQRAALRWLLPALAALLVAAPAAAQTTTVLVVRHAERESAERDSPLSELGRARARALDEALADAGVSAIHATVFQRTWTTASPLAARLGLEPKKWEVGDPEVYAAELSREIRGTHRGETVLVVSHSNTVPLIVRALGGSAPEEMSEREFQTLYVVTIPETGSVRTLRLRYGAPDPEPEPGA